MSFSWYVHNLFIVCSWTTIIYNTTIKLEQPRFTTLHKHLSFNYFTCSTYFSNLTNKLSWSTLLELHYLVLLELHDKITSIELIDLNKTSLEVLHTTFRKLFGFKWYRELKKTLHIPLNHDNRRWAWLELGIAWSLAIFWTGLQNFG